MRIYRKANFGRNRTTIRHSMVLISINLVMLASLAAPAAIILMPASSIGAPAPAPKPARPPALMDDINKLLKDMKDRKGKLGPDSIEILKRRSRGIDKKTGSARALDAFVNAVNEASRKEKTGYLLLFPIPENVKIGDKFEMQARTTDLNEFTSDPSNLGTGVYDFPPPDSSPAQWSQGCRWF